MFIDQYGLKYFPPITDEDRNNLRKMSAQPFLMLGSLLQARGKFERLQTLQKTILSIDYILYQVSFLKFSPLQKF